MKFFRCERCGNIITFLNEKCNGLTCCGADMKELVPGAVDGAFEKHVPAVSVDGNKVNVKVGEVAHPMLENHYITFVALETNLGSHIRYFNPNEVAEAEFVLAENEKPVAAYEYCNLHGLWKKDI